MSIAVDPRDRIAYGHLRISSVFSTTVLPDRDIMAQTWLYDWTAACLLVRSRKRLKKTGLGV